MEPISVLKEFDGDSAGLTLNLLHFNDVYNIEPSPNPEDPGGAAVFLGALNQLRSKFTDAITVFSGDILSPSSMSTITSGQQMIDLMPHFAIDYACVGNHDFDFGLDQLKALLDAPQSKTLWFLSNLLDFDTEKPLLCLHVAEIVEHQGIKLGIMGLVENEWIDTLGTIDRDDLLYKDFVETGRSLAAEMRKNGAQLVLALTHMRMPNDLRLLRQVKEIDLILGGHDHEDGFERSESGLMVKSGTDFRELSHIQVRLLADKSGGCRFNVDRYMMKDVSLDPDKDVELLVGRYVESIEEKLSEVIGLIDVDLDGRFTSIRRRESNLGNFVCDCVMKELDVDCVLLNSGSLRSDRVHRAGEFRLRDLRQILPMPDQMVVLKCSGHKLKEVLENAVSKWPSLEGRFLQVAGIKFQFDAEKPPGDRVIAESIKINHFPIDLDEDYVVAMKEYMYAGKDGYSMLADCPLLVDAENGPCLPNTVLNYFKAVSQWNEQKLESDKRHRLSIVSRQRSKTVLLSLHESQANPADQTKLTFKSVSTAVTQAIMLHRFIARRRLGSKSLASYSIADQACRHRIKKSVEFRRQISLMTKEAIGHLPGIEGRIVRVESEKNK